MLTHGPMPSEACGVAVIETTLCHGTVASTRPCPVLETGASAVRQACSRRDVLGCSRRDKIGCERTRKRDRDSQTDMASRWTRYATPGRRKVGFNALVPIPNGSRAASCRPIRSWPLGRRPGRFPHRCPILRPGQRNCIVMRTALASLRTFQNQPVAVARRVRCHAELTAQKKTQEVLDNGISFRDV